MSACPATTDPECRWLGRVDYHHGLRIQQALADARRGGTQGDIVLLLEHDPVYTIGRTPDKSSLTAAPAPLPHPVVEISRGGQATYHGPGQLVGYPVLDLQQRGKDLHRYLRALEDAVIDVCRAFGAPADRRDKLTGVWVDSRKLASIGVGVRHWVTLHGFALNVTPECLGGFGAIIPCGLQGVKMTCLTEEARRPGLTVLDVAEAMARPLRRAFEGLR